MNTVEFITHMDNDGPDNHPATPPNGGKRIFPGKKSHDDPHPEYRNIVKVKAMIVPPLDNKHVYFRSFDVDDPSSDVSPIDQNGSVGGDNHAAPAVGALSTTDTVTDGTGQAIVEFTVGMAPGDNYRIAASGSSPALEEPHLTQAMADAGTPPTGVKFTPMLTVWRKLWIEQHSMGAVATSGPEKNYVSGTWADYYLTQNPPPVTSASIFAVPADFCELDHFDNGWYKVPNISNPYQVWDFFPGGSPPICDVLTLNGNLIADGADTTYDLYDDDYTFAGGQPSLQASPALPQYPTLGGLSSPLKNS